MDEEDEEEVYGDFEDLETGKVWIMIRRILPSSDLVCTVKRFPFRRKSYSFTNIPATEDIYDNNVQERKYLVRKMERRRKKKKLPAMLIMGVMPLEKKKKEMLVLEFCF